MAKRKNPFGYGDVLTGLAALIGGRGSGGGGGGSSKTSSSKKRKLNPKNRNRYENPKTPNAGIRRRFKVY